MNAIFNPELFEDMLNMLSDGTAADPENNPSFAIGFTLYDPFQDLPFPIGQAGQESIFLSFEVHYSNVSGLSISCYICITISEVVPL
jgi:hypothetical protein